MHSYGFFGSKSKKKSQQGAVPPEGEGGSIDPGAVKGALDYYSSPSRQKANLLSKLAAIEKTRALLGGAGVYLDPAISAIKAKLKALETQVDQEQNRQGETNRVVALSQIALGAFVLAMGAFTINQLRTR